MCILLSITITSAVTKPSGDVDFFHVNYEEIQIKVEKHQVFTNFI